MSTLKSMTMCALQSTQLMLLFFHKPT